MALHNVYKFNSVLLKTALALAIGTLAIVITEREAFPQDFTLGPNIALQEGTGGFTPFTFQVSRTWHTSEKAHVNYSVTPFAQCLSVSHMAARIVGRHFYYHGSKFDDGNLDNAIAPDKTALLDGQTATFANYTSFSKGITGVVIDVQFLTGTPTLSDFEFHMGNSDDVNSWTVAPAPTLEFLNDPSINGVDRLVFRWNPNEVRQGWLQVKMLANSGIGLPFDDVSYFGNAIGEVGNLPGNSQVNLVDVALVRANQTGFSLAAIDNKYDINRDMRVNLVDVAITHKHQSGFNSVKLIEPDEGEQYQDIVFAPNELMTSFDVYVIADAFPELDEEFEILLTTAMDGTGQRTQISGQSSLAAVLNDDGNARSADVIFVLDISSSMRTAHQWLAEDDFAGPGSPSIITKIVQEFDDNGFCANRYGLLKFRNSVEAVRMPDVTGSLWVGSESIDLLKGEMLESNLINSPVLGQSAIAHALDVLPFGTEPKYLFRESAIVNIVLISDNESAAFSPSDQQLIINKLNIEEAVFTSITPTAMTCFKGDNADPGYSAGEECNNWAMFNKNPMNPLRDTWISTQDSVASLSMNLTNIAGMANLIDDYSNLASMAGIDRRQESGVPVGRPLNESWTITSEFMIESGIHQQNARIHFSAAAAPANPPFVTTSFVEVSTSDNKWRLHTPTLPLGVEFSLHQGATWKPIQLDQWHSVELRMFIPIPFASIGRFDLFVDGDPIASLDVDLMAIPNDQPDVIDAHGVRHIGFGCDQSLTSFRNMTFNIRRQQDSSLLLPLDPTPFSFNVAAPTVMPFKRAYFNEFGNVFGSSFFDDILGIDITDYPTGQILGTAFQFDPLAFGFVTRDRPNYSQAFKNSKIHYLDLAGETNGSIWNIAIFSYPNTQAPEIGPFGNALAEVLVNDNLDKVGQ